MYFLRKRLDTRGIWDSLFPNIWSKYDIDTRIWRLSACNNEIRVSVTTLITIALIHKKLIFDKSFISYFYWNGEFKCPWNVLQLLHRKIKYSQNVIFFSCEMSNPWTLIPLRFSIERMKIEEDEKLFANLHNKTIYVIYIKNLKQALNHEFVLKKFDRVIKGTLMQIWKSTNIFIFIWK